MHPTGYIVICIVLYCVLIFSFWIQISMYYELYALSDIGICGFGACGHKSFSVELLRYNSFLIYNNVGLSPTGLRDCGNSCKPSYSVSTDSGLCMPLFTIPNNSSNQCTTQDCSGIETVGD